MFLFRCFTRSISCSSCRDTLLLHKARNHAQEGQDLHDVSELLRNTLTLEKTRRHSSAVDVGHCTHQDHRPDRLHLVSLLSAANKFYFHRMDSFIGVIPYYRN